MLELPPVCPMDTVSTIQQEATRADPDPFVE